MGMLGLDSNMYNSSSSSSSSSSSEHNNKCPPLMSPRISFSNDFAESHHLRLHQQQVMRNQSPATPDFEFSVSSSNSNYSNMSSMTTADELFFKGQLLPFNPSSRPTTTLRDELLVVEQEPQHVSLRPPKSGTRWKSLLGLKNKKPNPHHSSSSTSKHFTPGNDE